MLGLRLLVLLIALLFAQQTRAEIGNITGIEGPSASIKRQEQKLEGKVDSQIESMDTVETRNSTVNIGFKDNTKVVIKEHSKLLIDDFVYNPSNSSGGKLGLKVALGTVRYASGQIAHANPQSVDIKTPTATIAVRGTDFNMTVDEIGRSLVVLVPSCVGSVCVTGKIEVSSLSGTVVLDQPYTATYVSQASQSPIQPVKINNITDKQINNLLIVAVPKEVRDSLKEKTEKQKEAETFQLELQQITNKSEGQQQDQNKTSSDNSVIIVENKNGNIVAYTKNDVDNTFNIQFGNSANATITLQRNQEIITTRIGNGSSKITIKQSK